MTSVDTIITPETNPRGRMEKKNSFSWMTEVALKPFPFTLSIPGNEKRDSTVGPKDTRCLQNGERTPRGRMKESVRVVLH